MELTKRQKIALAMLAGQHTHKKSEDDQAGEIINALNFADLFIILSEDEEGK